ncbi:MAG: hypothetical protein ACFCBW_12155, partial [Candidatus Competibacterales bacterium]
MNAHKNQVWKGVLLVLLALVFPEGNAFEAPELAAEAEGYRRLLMATQPAAADPPEAIARAIAAGHQAQWSGAIAAWEAVVVAEPTLTTAWRRLGEAWEGRNDGLADRSRARAALYQSYRVARSERGKARALVALGEILADSEPPRAMAAWQTALELVFDPELALRHQRLVAANAFRVVDVQVTADSQRPLLCLRFSQQLAKGAKGAIPWGDYLAIEPDRGVVVEARDRDLCAVGVDHGADYRLVVRPGVPAASGERLVAGESFAASVPHRTPAVGFRGNGYVLASGELASQEGVPLTTVNVAAVEVEILKIHDRNLVQAINDRRLGTPLSGDGVRDLANRRGERLGQTRLTIAGPRNEEVTTGVPVGELLADGAPGLYALVATIADGESVPDWQSRATQWLLISDLGLTTFRGRDGLHVFVRSLATAEPLAGVELALYARNNLLLGQVVSDAGGQGRFDPGLLRGEGGRLPVALMAYGP